MAWNHDDVGPGRPRHEMLSEVVRRGEGLRRRRRLVTGLGGTVALLLAVAGVAAVAAVVGPGGGSGTHLAAGGPTTTIHSLQATGGTVFAVDAPSTTAGPVEETATTQPRPVVTTMPADPEPSDPTTTAPTVPVATVPAGPPRCSPDLMDITLTFPQLTYRAGQTVVGQAVLRNRSGAPCIYASYTQSQEFRNAAGPVAPGQALIADNFADTIFAPGQTLTASPEWNQMMCVVDPSCPPAPPGTYSATVSWSFDGPPIQAVATFRVVP